MSETKKEETNKPEVEELNESEGDKVSGGLNPQPLPPGRMRD